MSEKQSSNGLFTKILIFTRDHWALVASLGYFLLVCDRYVPSLLVLQFF